MVRNLATSVGVDPHHVSITLKPAVHCNDLVHEVCVGPLIAGITPTAFSLTVTSSEDIAHGNCGVVPGLDYLSSHEPMMIADIYKR